MHHTQTARHQTLIFQALLKMRLVCRLLPLSFMVTANAAHQMERCMLNLLRSFNDTMEGDNRSQIPHLVREMFRRGTSFRSFTDADLPAKQ